MIKNQKQATIAKERLIELNQSLAELNGKQHEISSAEYTLGYNSLKYLIDDVLNDIKEYESLIKDNLYYFESIHLSDINKILISARISKRLSQSQLSKLLGIQEQQIQRYEASDYESATWTRIQEIALALDIKFNLKARTSNNRMVFQVPRNSSLESIERAKNKLKDSGCLNYAL